MQYLIEVIGKVFTLPLKVADNGRLFRLGSIVELSNFVDF